MSKSYRDRNLRYENLEKMSRRQIEQAYRSTLFNARKAVREIKAVHPRAIELAEHKNDFRTAKNLGEISTEHLIKETLRASNFLHSQFGSLEKYESYLDKSVATLSKYGVTKENFPEFSAFMKARRDEGLLGLVPSDFWMMANDIGKGKQFYDRVKSLERMLEQGRISEESAEANVRHWIEQTYEEAYEGKEFSRYYTSKRRKLKGSGSSDF